jgi:excinuclease ABC subunit A
VKKTRRKNPPRALPAAIAVEVEGADTHNLRHVSCRVPHGKVTVVTGVSGAGKSSLAFDTIYAEAQRRFIESMSTYVRQYLGQMERPPIEAMRNVLPALALEARNSVKNARSTVGTITEVHDILRLLFTHLGEVSCPNGHGPVKSSTPAEAVARLVGGFAGENVTLLAPLARPGKAADAKLKELVRQGYFRRLGDDGEIVRIGASERWPKALDPLILALGRFRAEENGRARLAEVVEEAYALTGGKLVVQTDVQTKEGWRHFGRALTCETCGERLERPIPALFSFNSPLGACTTCKGFGRVLGVDPQRVIPDQNKALKQRPIAPWNSPAHEENYAPLLAAAKSAGVRLDVPWKELTQEERDFVWRGQGRFLSVEKFFARLERKTYKIHVRILLARYRAYDPCPTCKNTRLKRGALAVKVQGSTLPELEALSVSGLREWLEAQVFPPGKAEAAGHFLDDLRDRLETLHRVGLDYLTIDRHARSLSGGESQRIQLASALSMAMTGMLFVLDEPTIGLHPQDSHRLLCLLRDLAGRGNAVLVVEHDRTLIEGADHVIDLGPGAGELGGKVIAEGDLAAIMASKNSATAACLHQPLELSPPIFEGRDGYELDRRKIKIRGAREHNLRGFDLDLPTRCLIAVTGVSGSGKSTLVENVIYGNWARRRGAADAEPGQVDELLGLEESFEGVEFVDQRPLGRSSRSNPATYTKVWDVFRKLFAATPHAKARGIEAGHFSFNTDAGRCPVCEGTGTTEIDMHFMEPVTLTCEECQGKRFKKEVLAVEWRGKNVDDILRLTVQEAAALFIDEKRIYRAVAGLLSVGLGYLRLGQSTATLSGGEAQRLKLAAYLAEKSPQPHLLLFDEPTTGLHLQDIAVLHGTFRQLVEAGHTVLVVEHSLDLIAKADYIVDLGPGGGSEGGELLFAGPIREFLERGEGPTARELRAALNP